MYTSSRDGDAECKSSKRMRGRCRPDDGSLVDGIGDTRPEGSIISWLPANLCHYEATGLPRREVARGLSGIL